jgi:hypothetical protein
MAVGDRFRSGGTRGIARFLADHQHCDSGFDVRREDEAGGGRLRITCLGCGQTIDYRAAEAGELAAAGLPLGPNGEAPPPPEPMAPVSQPPPAVPPPGARRIPEGLSRRPPPAGPDPYRRGIPGWIPVLLIGILIAGGLAMIAIGLTREDSDQTGSNAATPPAGTQPAPADEGRGGSNQQAQPAPATPQEGGDAEGGESPAPGGTLDKRTFLGRFEIGVPAGWDAGRNGDAVVLTAPGGVAAVRVVSQQGEFPDSSLAEGAESFLASEHPDGRIGSSDRVRLAGRPATRVRATYPGGTDTAYALSAGGFSYLISVRIERGASADVSAQAEAALQSFRPR